jgi:3'-phosphoadenosine 5'-phosphosulfate sulfotransferase (PAPS reductase)/FAD synthetase
MRALAWNPDNAMHEPTVLDEVNSDLERRPAEDRVRWALDHLPGEHALSSSFGAQAAVSLHMVTRAKPSLPVVLIDTGYLFSETYRFIDDLVLKLDLNLHVYQPQHVAGLARGALRPALGAGHRRHRALQRSAQDRADAASAHRARREDVVRGPAP